MYVNSDVTNLRVDLLIEDFRKDKKQIPAKPKRVGSILSNKSSALNKSDLMSKLSQGKGAKDKDLDLDLILKERGLDIFYMQQVINEYKYAKDLAAQNAKMSQKRASRAISPEAAAKAVADCNHLRP